MEIEITKKLYDEIDLYCKTNNINNIPNFIQKLVKKGFDLEKWGDINIEAQKPNIPSTEPIIAPKVIKKTPKQQKNIIDTQEDIDIYEDN